MKLSGHQVSLLTGLVIALSAGLLAKSSARGAPWYIFSRPPTFDAPFDPRKKGVATEGTLKVPVKDSYNFYIRVRSETDTPGGRHKAQAFAGVKQISSDGEVVNNPPLTLPLSLIIEEVDKQGSVFRIQRYSSQQPLNESSARDFYNLISSVVLPKGDYKLRLESLHDFPLPANIELFLNVHVPSR